MFRSLPVRNIVVACLGTGVAILFGLYVGRGNMGGSIQLIMFMIGAVLAISIQPRYLLLAAVVLQPFEFLPEKLPIHLPMNLLPADIALFAYVVSAAVRRLSRPAGGEDRSARAPVIAAGVLAILLLAVGLFSAFESGATMVAARKLGRIVMIVLGVWATPRVLKHEDVMLCCKALLTIAGLTAVYALIEGGLDLAGVQTRIWEHVGPLPRLLGGFKDPNYFAHFLAMVTPLALARVLMGARLWSRQLVILALVIVAAIGTFSRGGAIGLGAGVFAVLGFTFLQPAESRRSSSGRTLSVVAGFAAFLAVLASSTPNIWSVISNRFSGAAKYSTDPTAVLRIRIWKNALQLLATSPIYGIGPGQFLERMAKANPDTAFYAHNSLLEATVEMGIVGGALLLVVIVLLLGASLASARMFMRPENYGTTEDIWSVGLVGGLLGGVVSSFFLSNALYEPITAVVLILASSLWSIGFKPSPRLWVSR